MKWSVHAYRLGSWGAIPGPELYWMSDWGHWEPMSLIGVFARAEDGTTLVVNTGPPLDYLDYMNGLWKGVHEECQLRVAPEEQIEAALVLEHPQRLQQPLPRHDHARIAAELAHQQCTAAGSESGNSRGIGGHSFAD